MPLTAQEAGLATPLMDSFGLGRAAAFLHLRSRLLAHDLISPCTAAQYIQSAGDFLLVT